MTPVRIAVVGCGNVSDMHFRGLLAHPDRVQVVAACDPVAERRRHVQATYGVPDTFEDVKQLLDGADVAVAVVCTPSQVRLEAVRALAERGVHVLVEKPMADSMEEAEALVEFCQQAGVQLAVNQNFRDHYAFGLAREAIGAGAIGRVIGIDQRELLFREVQGWRAKAKHHALAVMGVHWFDGFRYLLPDDADWLVARTYSAPGLDTAGETDAFVQVHFGDATVNYTQSFSSHVQRVETVVLGERGTLALGYDAMQLVGEDGFSTTTANPYAGAGKPESAFRSLERLLVAVEEGTEPTNSGADNLKTLSLLFAAYASAESDAPVALTNGLL